MAAKTLLPKKNRVVSLDEIQLICERYGQSELWAKIKKDPPDKPFKSDGCSMWFDEWAGESLYPACFLHDLKYWAGYDGEEVARLVADAELMIDIAKILSDIGMAVTMFHGVRVGGADIFKRSFSWGFGRTATQKSTTNAGEKTS